MAWQARRDDGDRADSENSRPIEQEANAHGSVLHPRPRGKPSRFPPRPGTTQGGEYLIRLYYIDWLTNCLTVEKEALSRPDTRKPHHAFSRHGEAVGSIREVGRPFGRPGKCSSASDRLFLSGLLASRARLRFTGC